MRKMYRSPSLTEYGALEQITLGSGGALPDVVSGVTVNNNCGSQTFTGISNGNTSTFTRTTCLAS